VVQGLAKRQILGGWKRTALQVLGCLGKVRDFAMSCPSSKGLSQ